MLVPYLYLTCTLTHFSGNQKLRILSRWGAFSMLDLKSARKQASGQPFVQTSFADTAELFLQIPHENALRLQNVKNNLVQLFSP